MKRLPKYILLLSVILSPLYASDVEQYRMYNYQALLDIESARLEALISGGSTNSILPEYRSFLLKGNYSLVCHQQRFSSLNKEKRALDNNQIDAYATLAHRFQVKYQPFYEEFFVNMHSRLRSDSGTDYFSIFVSMDSLWTWYSSQQAELNRKYVKNIEVLKAELKSLDKQDREYREFLGRSSGRMLKRSRQLTEALEKYKKKAASGISHDKAEINVGTLTWNLENFGEYASCDFEDSFNKLLLETDLLLKLMEQ